MLLVEHDRDLRVIFEQLLRAEGIDVRSVQRTDDPDAASVDVVVVDLDGVAREADPAASLDQLVTRVSPRPVVALSGVAARRQLTDGALHRVGVVIDKPFRVERLLAAIAQAIR